MKNSKLLLRENIIVKNISNGVYSRDKSQIKFEDNQIFDNKIDVIIENKKGIIGNFDENKQLGISNRYYLPKSCIIF